MSMAASRELLPRRAGRAISVRWVSAEIKHSLDQVSFLTDLRPDRRLSPIPIRRPVAKC